MWVCTFWGWGRLGVPRGQGKKSIFSHWRGQPSKLLLPYTPVPSSLTTCFWVTHCPESHSIQSRGGGGEQCRFLPQETFLMVITWRGVVTGIQWTVARDAAKHPTMQNHLQPRIISHKMWSMSRLRTLGPWREAWVWVERPLHRKQDSESPRVFHRSSDNCCFSEAGLSWHWMLPSPRRSRNPPPTGSKWVNNNNMERSHWPSPPGGLTRSYSNLSGHQNHLLRHRFMGVTQSSPELGLLSLHYYACAWHNSVC